MSKSIFIIIVVTNHQMLSCRLSRKHGGEGETKAAKRPWRHGNCGESMAKTKPSLEVLWNIIKVGLYTIVSMDILYLPFGKLTELWKIIILNG